MKIALLEKGQEGYPLHENVAMINFFLSLNSTTTSVSVYEIMSVVKNYLKWFKKTAVYALVIYIFHYPFLQKQPSILGA